MSDSLQFSAGHSPCRRPMRKRDTVMETMGCEQKRARMGVNAVMAPHAVADSNITFSPPTLFKNNAVKRHVVLETLQAVAPSS